MPMGVEIGGGGGEDASPAVKKLVGDVHSTFENEVDQIRCLFRFWWYLWGRLVTLPTIRPSSKKKRGDAPANAPPAVSEIGGYLHIS